MNAQKAVIVHVAEPFKQRKNKNINNGKRSRSYTITYWIWAFSSCSLNFEYRQYSYIESKLTESSRPLGVDYSILVDTKVTWR